eukprot:CAMPEP_0115355956 /NCGR_PEP_ID=MMETSP0270-20121206/99363_1 /TAXON_ID=71861 /ORGANISM="Scrippsiella trochoidea, Strain CCMP3099" /LENGTH=427 /DNA_ID=CAMNT_0002778325 /DNA_START=39 /DNA_END=1319 /DNA_ORIENTATION=-
MNNPQFAFLYNGEGADYYHHVLAGFRGNGYGGVPGAGSGMQQAVGGEFAELLQRYKEPPALEEVIASLEAMASRDAIRGGRAWIECNSAMAQQIAGNIMARLVGLQSCAHRLHVLYLVHDVLQTDAARKDGSRPLIRAFKPYLPWMLRPAYQLAYKANPNGDELGRVLRLLQLWVERDILDAKEAEDMKALVTLADLPGAAPSHGASPTSRPGSPLAAQGMAPGMQAAHLRPQVVPMGHPGASPIQDAWRCSWRDALRGRDGSWHEASDGRLWWLRDDARANTRPRHDAHAAPPGLPAAAAAHGGEADAGDGAGGRPGHHDDARCQTRRSSQLCALQAHGHIADSTDAAADGGAIAETPGEGGGLLHGPEGRGARLQHQPKQLLALALALVLRLALEKQEQKRRDSARELAAKAAAGGFSAGGFAPA